MAFPLRPLDLSEGLTTLWCMYRTSANCNCNQPLMTCNIEEEEREKEAAWGISPSSALCSKFDTADRARGEELARIHTRYVSSTYFWWGYQLFVLRALAKEAENNAPASSGRVTYLISYCCYISIHSQILLWLDRFCFWLPTHYSAGVLLLLLLLLRIYLVHFLNSLWSVESGLFCERTCEYVYNYYWLLALTSLSTR